MNWIMAAIAVILLVGGGGTLASSKEEYSITTFIGGYITVGLGIVLLWQATQC